MSPRERRLVLVLGLFLALGVVAAGYGLVFTPLAGLKDEAARIEDDLSTKQTALAKLIKDKPRAEAAKKRSLPADPDHARAEYYAMMQKLLIAAGAPAGFSITSRDTLDAKSVPTLDPKTKQPAYAKFGYEIRMKRVDKGTVARFLHSYYRLNLLHQITRLEIIRKEQDGGAKARGERSDLEVVIQTEAIILDGAENRQTLLPMPLGAAAVGGGAGYHALLNSREAGRGISPLQLADVLATSKPPRDYTLITAKDFIHGPLPPPSSPKVEVAEAAPPPKPKEDISPFVKLTGITRRSDGTAQVDVWDQLNNQDYQIDLTPKGERYEVKVQKFYRISPAKKGRYYSEALLTITEDDTATNRQFRVVGLDGDGLVLTESATSAAGAGKGGVGKGKLSAPPPAAAVVGGAGIALAPAGEAVLVWRAGQSLKDLTAVPANEVDAVLRRAAPAYPTTVTADPSSPTSAPLSKAD